MLCGASGSSSGGTSESVALRCRLVVPIAAHHRGGLVRVRVRVGVRVRVRVRARVGAGVRVHRAGLVDARVLLGPILGRYPYPALAGLPRVCVGPAVLCGEVAGAGPPLHAETSRLGSLGLKDGP